MEETQDIAPIYIDTKTAKLLHDMGAQTNPQLNLDLVDLPTRRFKMNGVNITLEQCAIIVKENIFEFSDGFINFLTNPNVTYNDKIEEDENKTKRFLFDIRYDVGKVDKKSSRHRTIRSILLGQDGVFGSGSNSICEAGSLIDIHEGAPPLVPQADSPINPNNLVERLELLILETKAGHD